MSVKRTSLSHPWTFKIVLEYHACKRCGYIIESRSDAIKKHQGYFKEIQCHKCQFQFEVEEKNPPRPY